MFDDDAKSAMLQILEVLYPNGNYDHEWEAEDIERIAAVADKWRKAEEEL